MGYLPEPLFSGDDMIIPFQFILYPLPDIDIIKIGFFGF